LDLGTRRGEGSASHPGRFLPPGKTRYPVAQSVQRLATGWTVRGSNFGGGEIFRTFPDRTRGPPSLLYNGYRVFPGGGKPPGRDADPSPLLVPWSVNRVDLYLYAP
jgi:hypothetical protein